MQKHVDVRPQRINRIFGWRRGGQRELDYWQYFSLARESGNGRGSKSLAHQSEKQVQRLDRMLQDLRTL